MYWSEEEHRVPHLNMNIKSKFDLMQKPASRGQSLSGPGRGIAQYANTRGLNNYNYVDGQHLSELLKYFPCLKSKLFFLGTVRGCQLVLTLIDPTPTMRTRKGLTPMRAPRQDRSSKLQIM